MADNKQVSEFIASYDGDPSRIAFSWNGSHGDDFADSNHKFRDTVVARILTDPERASLQLLIDLYTAMTRCSVESWSIDSRVEDIARLMLSKGRADVALPYLEGAMCSFDAHCATSFEGLPRPVAEACLEFAQAKYANAQGEDQNDFWEAGVERFTKLLEFADG